MEAFDVIALKLLTNAQLLNVKLPFEFKISKSKFDL
jgi:hypothetical protein